MARHRHTGPLAYAMRPAVRACSLLVDLMPLPRQRRSRRIVVAVWVALGVTVGLASVPMFIAPARAQEVRADAIVVLAGGSGERIERGIDLAVRGFGEVLVVSTGTGSRLDDVDCDAGTGPGGITVLCAEPPFDTTRGEAQMVAALAEAHGWDRVLLVTSSYHLRRATWKFERCLDAEVVPIAAEPDLALPAHFNAVFHEWVGVAIAQTVSRAC